jgi:hypothetical protein
MLFNSYVFIFGSLPVTLLVFFWLGQAARNGLALAWLVVASTVPGQCLPTSCRRP